MMMSVDHFFRISKISFFESNDNSLSTGYRRSINMLTYDEASDIFGFTQKEDLDLLDCINKRKVSYRKKNNEK